MKFEAHWPLAYWASRAQFLALGLGDDGGGLALAGAGGTLSGADSVACIFIA